ncbi:MAG: hypothetical protein JSS02_18675 [Planctomycetes bacterium]|nr:hypothetical protein [Planctomycetota bacterium]
MIDHNFYGQLANIAAGFVKRAVGKTLKKIDKIHSPLRAMCIEYDEQCAFNLRVELEAAWLRRDEQDQSYHIKINDDWQAFSKAKVLSLISAQRVTRKTLCQRRMYREFTLDRFFPSAFGIDRPAAHDWSWEYEVGYFDTIATPDDQLFELLQEYWLALMEVDPDGWMLPDKLSGTGETYSYTREHFDILFVDSVKAAICTNERAILSLPHTTDFIAFVSVVESDFRPDTVCIGDTSKFR